MISIGKVLSTATPVVGFFADPVRNFLFGSEATYVIEFSRLWEALPNIDRLTGSMSSNQE